MSLKSKRLFSRTTIQKHQFSVHNFLYGKTIYWTIWMFVCKWCLCFFNISRFVIAFLSRGNHLWISLQSPYAVTLKPKKIKSVTVLTFPHICHKVMGPEAMILVSWMLSYEPAFSPSSFTLIKRLLNFSSHSVIRMVSTAYLRLLIFLMAVLNPACDSSSPAFCLM